MEATIALDGVPADINLVRDAKDREAWTVDLGDGPVLARIERNGMGVVVRIGDRSLHVELVGTGQARIDGRRTSYEVLAVTGGTSASAAGAGHATHVRPPMNGKLESVRVQVGQSVAKGDVLFVLEAMKMQNEVRAPSAGRVAAIHLAAGATVEPKQVVLDLEPL